MEYGYVYFYEALDDVIYLHWSLNIEFLIVLSSLIM
jgi:hypothetical protein